MWETRCYGCGIHKPDTTVELCDRCIDMEVFCDANPKNAKEEQMWDEAMKLSDEYVKEINAGEDT